MTRQSKTKQNKTKKPKQKPSWSSNKLMLIADTCPVQATELLMMIWRWFIETRETRLTKCHTSKCPRLRHNLLGSTIT